MRWASARPSGGWRRFLWRLALLLSVSIAPWPGLATPFARAMAGACDAVAGVVSDAEVHFVAERYAPEHPWWVQMSVKNVFTSESFEVPVDTRTVGYLRIVVFLSFSLAWPFWAMRRGIEATLGGLAILAVLIGLTVVLPLLQVLGMVKVLALGVLAQSALSIVIMTLGTYPSMAFAIPGLVWLVVLRFMAGGAKESAETSRGTAQGSGAP
jgi:hypothetical protein